jgi:TPR repeat protein
MKTGEEQLEELRKRVEANDAGAMCQLGCYYHKGGGGLLQDCTKAIELWTHSAKLGSSQAHWYLGNESHEGGDLKKAKFHFEISAMAGHEVARCNLGNMEFELVFELVKIERCLKHFSIAASTGDYNAMHNLQKSFEQGLVS